MISNVMVKYSKLLAGFRTAANLLRTAKGSGANKVIDGFPYIIRCIDFRAIIDQSEHNLREISARSAMYRPPSHLMSKNMNVKYHEANKSIATYVIHSIHQITRLFD